MYVYDRDSNTLGIYDLDDMSVRNFLRPPGTDYWLKLKDRDVTTVTFPEMRSQIMHIFRDAPGHLKEYTPANRQLLVDTANNPKYQLGSDERGHTWSAFTRDDGTQVWVKTRYGVIQEGGVNTIPYKFDPLRGIIPEGD